MPHAAFWFREFTSLPLFAISAQPHQIGRDLFISRLRAGRCWSLFIGGLCPGWFTTVELFTLQHGFLGTPWESAAESVLAGTAEIAIFLRSFHGHSPLNCIPSRTFSHRMGISTDYARQILRAVKRSGWTSAAVICPQNQGQTMEGRIEKIQDGCGKVPGYW